MVLDHLPGTFFGPSTLVELVRHRAKHQRDDVAFTYLIDGEDETEDMTNGELDRRARAIGAWLESHNLVGERALLLYPPGLEFITAFFGCLYAGVVAVPVYPPRRNRSLERIQAIADDSDAKVALTTDSVLERVEKLIDETPHLKELTWLATSRLDDATAEGWEMPDIHADTLAFLQYTSGSTGSPKGVMLDHANLVHNSALISYGFEHSRSGVGVFWLPSYHDMGLIGGILQPLYVGRPNVLMSPMSFLQRPLRWLRAITKYRGSTCGGPNFAYDLCVRKITDEQIDELDLSSWDVAFNGAEPVRAETLEAFSDRFARCGFRREAFYPCYGLAEATLIVTGGWARRPPVIRSFDANALGEGRAKIVDSDSPASKALVGCGENLPDQRVVIADPETRTSCGEGEIGEVWVAGPSVALGYWRRPDVNQEIFKARLAESGEGPFLRTGDLGFIHENELFLTGRIKDLIILHGVNIYPQDVEQTVQESHERLRPDSGAVFLAEVNGQERLVAVHEVERHRTADNDEIIAAIRRAVSRQHELGLDAVVLVKAGSVPKTTSGKIQRHACRNGYLDGTLSVVAQWEVGQPLDVDERPIAAVKPQIQAAAPVRRPLAESAPGRNGRKASLPKPPASFRRSGSGKSTEQIVLEEVRRVARDRADGMDIDTRITELGMDSLERMEIVAALEERFGGRFPEEVLPGLITARQVVDAVRRYLGGEVREVTGRPAGYEPPPESYRFDRFPEYVKLREGLDLLESTGLSPYFGVHEGVTGDTTIIDGRKLINFSSYNYLGMSGDPVVVEAAQHACQRYGTSVSASRLVSGEKDLHGDLERAISDWVGSEDAIVYVGGHSTNESTIGHLFGPGDLILHDALSHNSILQGAVLSGARRRPFPHNDWDAANEILESFRHEYRRVLLVVEGVYSMDGDIPELPRFVDVKRRHRAILMVDEAHSMGVLGSTGRGICEHFGVDPAEIDIQMGTLSKAFGSCGGYIAGSRALVEYLKYTSPGFVYSVGLSPPNAAAALASIRLLQAEPQRPERLRQRARLFLELARSRGIDTGRSQDSPVVPVILGNSMHALQLSKALFARGINVQPILYPAVEESAARLRFFVTSLHREEQIRFAVDCIVEELEKINPAHLIRAASGEATS
ncbi:MAG: aminotransferase class I/II-fold pyridoxal phosphate-dependent enzyme [Planctomycetaceae bacterium]|nr:aminotransferase class I/II-fold pyridoxal phosphate-dependent enzyme [Planctomycetaceae bacterium]